jgi:hypothetical protein
MFCIYIWYMFIWCGIWVGLLFSRWRSQKNSTQLIPANWERCWTQNGAFIVFFFKYVYFAFPFNLIYFGCCILFLGGVPVSDGGLESAGKAEFRTTGLSEKFRCLPHVFGSWRAVWSSLRNLMPSWSCQECGASKDSFPLVMYSCHAYWHIFLLFSMFVEWPKLLIM